MTNVELWQTVQEGDVWRTKDGVIMSIVAKTNDGFFVVFSNSEGRQSFIPRNQIQWYIYTRVNRN